MTFEETIRDARHGVRRWRDRPLFALAAVATIALATGAATALFSMVDGVLLKPLPFPSADRLVIVNRTYPEWVSDPILSKSWDRISLAWPEFFDVRARARTVEAFAVRTSALGLLPPDATSGARELRVDVVSAGYFPLFGVRPIAGRLFEPEDDLADRKVVLLGEALWRARFGADPAVVGRPLPLADGARTIVGIVPASFRVGLGRPDIWEPLSATPASRRVDNDRNLDAYARMREGVTLADVTAEMDALLRANFRYQSRTGARVTLLAERLVAPVRTALFVLLGGALLLLVMACANIAGFLMGDASGRVHEMRVRAALGARRGRLVRQLLVESGLLAGAGGLAGALVAAWGVRVLIALAPANVPRLALVALDVRALGFAVAATAAAALLAGAIPAIVLARGAAGAVAPGSARVTPAHRRTQARLLVVQLALGVTMLGGAGLFVRTLENLDRTDTGFTRARILSARVSLPAPLYTRPAQWRHYFQRAEEAIARLPGVEAAAVSSGLPFATGRASTSIVLGDDAIGGRREVEAQRRFVSPGYFRVMEMPILEGRGFSAADPEGGDAFVVVSSEMARRFWNGRAIGKRFAQGRTAFVVAGVTRDVRDQALSTEPMSTFYVSTVQRPPWATMRIVARTAVPPSTLADSARKALRDIDPAVPIEDVTTMEALVSTSLEEPRYRAVLLTALASVAALLAAIGLYGAIARAVAERRREIGVRLALGARPHQVTRLFLREAARLAAVGGALGLLGAAAAARVSANLLFGVGTLDAWTLAIVAGSAAAIAIGGGYFPARRASRLDPIAALRES
jgi:predicted permease